MISCLLAALVAVDPSCGTRGWRAEGIEKGEYRVKLVHEGPAGKVDPGATLALKGKAIGIDRATGAKPSADGKRETREIYSVPVTLANGDVVAFAPWREGTLVGSPELVKTVPDEAYERAYDTWYYGGSRHAEVKGVTFVPGRFSAEVVNVSGVAGEVKVDVEIRDFWRKTVAKKSFADASKIEFDFPTAGDTESYRAYLDATMPAGAKFRRVYTCEADVTTGFHNHIWFDKGWEVACTEDDGTYETRCFRSEPPVGTKWTKRNFPDTLRGWPKFPESHQRWYRKTFRLPACLKGKRVFFEAERTAMRTEIRVNGQWFDANPIWKSGTFYRRDITSALKPDDENEIFIATQLRTAVFSDEFLRSGKRLSDEAATDYRYGTTTWGVFGLTALVGMPEKAIVEEPRITTSFREKTITVEYGRKDGHVGAVKLPAGTKLIHRVLFDGKEVVPPFEHQAKWENPILWGPTEFPLLVLESRLVPAVDGPLGDRPLPSTPQTPQTSQTFDLRQTRFGFREFWCEGMNFMWNGKSVRAPGRAMIPRWGEDCGGINTKQKLLEFVFMLKDRGNTFMKHCYGTKVHLDFADEQGVLVAKGSELTPAGHFGGKYVESSNYWKNMERNCLAAVDSYGNAPSLFTWYLSNEFYIESLPEAQRKFAPVIAALQAYDPGRFCECGCDIDAGGRTRTMSTHYPIGTAMRNDECTFPDLFYLRPIDRDFRVGEKIPSGQDKHVANQSILSPITWGTKPVMVNETNWDYFMGFPHSPARIWGDDAYNGTSFTLYMHHAYGYEYMKGERDALFYCLVNWFHAHDDVEEWSIPRNEAFAIERYHSFYEGEKVNFQLDFIHDVFATEKIATYWKLVDAKTGTQVAGERKVRDADFCVTFKDKAAFDAPKAGAYRLVYGIEGRVERIHEINTYRRGRSPGAPFAALADAGVIVVKPADPIDAALIAKAEAGAVVFVEPREDYPESLPMSFRLTTRTGDRNFTFRPNHPLLKGLSEQDLSFWYPKHVTGTKYFDKPDCGAALSVIETAGQNGLCYSGLVEFPYGKGTILLSRLELDPGKNPIAAKILANLAAYRPVPRVKGNGKLAIWFDATNDVVGIIRKSGVAYASCPADLSGFAAAYVDGAKYGPEKFAAFNGTVIVKDPSPAWGVELKSFKRDDVRGRLVKLARANHDPLLEGLTNYDFFWRNVAQGNSAKCQFGEPKAAQCDMAKAEIFGAEELTYPRFFARRGKVLFTTIDWPFTKSQAGRKGSRVLTTIFANAGVKVEAARLPSVPANLVFEPVDLAKILTRTLEDAKDDDGVGGWSDQGPVQDMHLWKIDAGVHRLGNAEFRIERPKAVVPLASRYRKVTAETPERIDVPVGRKAAWLFWLQSGAWLSKQLQCTVEVKYADGAVATCELWGGRNLRDYGAESPESLFPEEVDTITCCAAKAPHGLWKWGSVYSTAWRNPYPEKTVTTVSFVSAKKGVVMILALSTGNAATAFGADGMSENTGDAKKAAALMTRARAAKKANDLGESIRLAAEAFKANPSDFSICNELGDFHMDSGDRKQANRWYRQSLKINYNQPPIWEKEKASR